MKFTGIVASLAIASTASAAALPAVPVDVAVTKLNGVLGNLDTVLGGLLGGAVPSADLTQVKSQLTGIKGMLGKCTGIAERDVLDAAAPVEDTAESTVSTVEGTVGGAVNTVGGVVGGVAARDSLGDLTGLSQNIVSQVQGGTLDAAGVEQLLGLVQAGDLTSALNILSLL